MSAAVSTKSRGRLLGSSSDREPAVQRGNLIQSIDRLNADEPHSREIGDGRQLGQRERPEPIHRILQASLPGDAYQQRSPIPRLVAVPPRAGSEGVRTDRGAKGLTPTFHDERLGREIRDLIRHRALGRAEDRRQAHERGMDLAARHGGGAVERQVDAGASRDDPEQPGLRGDEDQAAAFLDPRGIADELERVAVALLGVQQDGPAVELLAAPERAIDLQPTWRRHRSRHSCSGHPRSKSPV